jgi:hypothetical protein
MKKLTRLVLVGLFAASCGLTNIYAVDTLEEAIEREAGYILQHAPANSVLAVVNIKSDSTELSAYVMERMPDYLIGNRRGITLVDRSKVDLIQQELDFQYSGEVSEDTMVSIGQKIGARIIVTGAISDSGNTYTFSVKLLDVETAAILGSSSTKVQHDDLMKSYLPNSQVAQNNRIRAVEKQQKKDTTVRQVKNVLGIFSNGFYLGYLGSLNSPIGISIGGINKKTAIFLDNEFCPPNFSGYEISEDASYKGNTVTSSSSDSGYSSASYTDSHAKTAFRWNAILGMNINIIESFLWLNAGAGIEYKEEYKLYERYDVSAPRSESVNVWVKNSFETQDKFKFAVSAGVFVKLWYFYLQGKYMYVIGDEIDYSTYGLNHLSLGLGYVWKRE